METFLWLSGIYLVIGFFKACAHLNSGKVGSLGPYATLMSITLLWPFI